MAVRSQRMISQRKHDLTHPMISDSYPILGKITIGGIFASLASFITFAYKMDSTTREPSDSELCFFLSFLAPSLVTVASASLMGINEAIQKGKLLYKLRNSVKIRDLLLRQQIYKENHEKSNS